jgi:hypothetical protein
MYTSNMPPMCGIAILREYYRHFSRQKNEGFDKEKELNL